MATTPGRMPPPLPLSRRDALRALGLLLAAPAFPQALRARAPDPDSERLRAWVERLRAAGLAETATPLGRAVARAGEQALGTPYVAGTLEEYLRAGGDPAAEPLTLSLTRFDCVTLVEASIAVARVALDPCRDMWRRFATEIERVRYRDGRRAGYATRLHYFSEWIADGARRGLLQDLTPTLGGAPDNRPLRFMTEHRASYPALADDATFAAIGAMEQRLDAAPRTVIPTDRIAAISDRIESGDVLAFATAIPGLDVTHTALAWRRPDGVLGVLHAPLSGGVVEVARLPLTDYVAAIRRATGIMVARPLPGGEG